MKVILLILMILHAAIHLLGFLKGFQLTEITQLSMSISKPVGLLWLLVAILFTLALFGFVFNLDFWIYLTFFTIIASQILVVLHWKDAAYGTIVNIILLLLVLPHFGKQQFDKKVSKEKTALIHSFNTSNNEILRKDEILNLPASVQNWLLQSGAVGSPKTVGAHLIQSGKLKTKPNSKWLPFQAEQHFNVKSPAFLWVAEVELFSGVILSGRDRLEEGTGEMLIKLASLIPVVNEKDNHSINTGAMIRFLGEICWFPSAAVNEYINWEELDSLSAKATFTGKTQSVSGIFHFTEGGELSSFEALRYFGGGKDAQRHLWKIEVLAYKTFEGIKVPALCRVIWKLPEGDFEWLQLSVTEVNYNPTNLYD